MKDRTKLTAPPLVGEFDRDEVRRAQLRIAAYAQGDPDLCRELLAMLGLLSGSEEATA